MTDEAPPSNLPTLPTSRKEWARIIDTIGIRPSKGMGQNFLFERGIVQRMVKTAGITKDDLVIEVGPGLGILTDELLRKAGEVRAIELDRILAAHIRHTFKDVPNFTLFEGDALSIDLNDIVPADRPYVLAANLPYAVGSAVLRRFLELPHPPTKLTTMVQREVAERIIASPPDMSVLGVAAQFYSTPRIAFIVSPTVFMPPPKVESAVIVFHLRKQPLLPHADHKRFFTVVNAGFRHKRKMVANSMADEIRLPKAEVTEWIEAAGIAPTRRAETLSVEEWVTLTKHVPREVLP